MEDLFQNTIIIKDGKYDIIVGIILRMREDGMKMNEDGIQLPFGVWEDVIDVED